MPASTTCSPTAPTADPTAASPSHPLARLAAMAHDAGDQETERWFLALGQGVGPETVAPSSPRRRMRRRRGRGAWLALVVAAAILFGGCASTTETTAETPEDEASPIAESGSPESAFPVTIEHKYGSVEIAEEPTRVLSLGYSDQDPILALGVTPIAVRYWYGDTDDAVFPWAEEAAGGARPEVLEMPELNYEKIAALRPDLIVGTYSGVTAEEYALLAEIAPTLAQSGDFIDYGMPWQDLTRSVGRALGRAPRAEALVADVEARFAAARAAQPEFDGASLASVSGPTEGNYGFFASADPRARFFADLGFALPAEFEDIAGEQFYGDVSAEQLDLFDRDVVVFQQIQFLDQGRAGLEGDPFVRELEAAGQGRIIYADDALDNALAFNSVLSLPYVLERIVPMLAAAVDGDLATEAPA